ncbi:MAG: protein-ADP-ribose hydrolase [Lachnospiraceae bacterium]
MNQKERLDYLVNFLCEDSDQYKKLQFAENEKRNALRSLMNIRMPKYISSEFLQIQDDFLKQELLESGIVSWKEIPHIGEQFGIQYEHAQKVALWQGDITKLKVDAIVNAANSQMLGCFAPCHKCIDNAIHSAAGVELREECNSYMKAKKKEDPYYEEPTGRAVLTKGYNLSCRYVLHTVGPIVKGALTESLKQDLRDCYRSCFQEAMSHGIRTIAFCCISTGEFHFPNEEAVKIAWTTIKEILNQHADRLDRVVINVFKKLDLELYQELLSKEA